MNDWQISIVVVIVFLGVAWRHAERGDAPTVIFFISLSLINGWFL